MNKTYCIAEMKFIDVTALTDSEVSTASGQDVDNLSLFHEENMVDVDNYALLEHNLFILNGTKKIPNNPTDIAFLSSVISKNDCTFDVNPVITVDFDEQHTSSGITFYFDKYFPDEIKITWYSKMGTKLITKTFNPDALIYTANHQVTNYGKVEVEFVKTCLPGQYIHLQYILYGKYVAWKSDVIEQASITEEIDVTGATVSINTADISIIDEADGFNIGNPDGAWKSVQKTQEVTVTEFINEKEIPAGTFYIDTFSFRSNVASFSLIDAIGYLDKYTFYDGTIYENATVGSIVSSIMATASFSKYTIEEEVAQIKLSGHLGIMSCREALQIVAFACGAVIDDSRSDTIKIYMPDKYVNYIIGVERKFNGTTTIAQEEYVSGVSIEYSRYTLSDETFDIYDDILPAGETKITFSDPYKVSSIVTSAGQLIDVHTNYLIIKMDVEGQCKITGLKYEKNDFTVEKNVDLIEAGEFKNVKEYTGCTLYNANIVQDKLEALLNYHSLRKIVEMEYLPQSYEKSGIWVNIKDVMGNNNASLIESQQLDLTGGFISTAKCRGYNPIINDYGYYTGNEVVTNPGIGGYIL